MDEGTFEHWEQLAAWHGTGRDRLYDLDAIVAGGSHMHTDERAALARATNGRGVRGLDVMHLQCHIGVDSITLAREGGQRHRRGLLAHRALAIGRLGPAL